jgi:hypothetical protein
MALAVAVATAFCTQQSFADPNDVCLVEQGEEMKKVAFLAESVYWPAFNYNDVIGYISEPNSTIQNNFIELVNQAIDPNYLPENLVEKTRFLKGWRGEANKNFVVQYEKQPYLIRIRNQTTTVIASRKWISHWITIAIQLKDETACVNKSNLKAIFNFTDQFLSTKVNSKAQDYSHVKNMDRPILKQIDEGYFFSYLVQASKPDIDFVNIWTDGRTVIINLKERRKEISERFNPQQEEQDDQVQDASSPGGAKSEPPGGSFADPVSGRKHDPNSMPPLQKSN